MRRTLVVAAVLAFTTAVALNAYACGEDSQKSKSASASETHCGTQANTASAKNLVPQPGAKLGDVVRCPVNGEVFTVASNHPRVKFAKNSYVACCKDCAVAFKKDPKRYVNNKA